MKYIAIIYGNQQLWESFTPDQLSEAIADMDVFIKKYQATGELLAAYGLGDAVQAKTVRVRDGVAAITDGPYLETKEYLSSVYLLDVASHERAMEVVADNPYAAQDVMEVWPILHDGMGDM